MRRFRVSFPTFLCFVALFSIAGTHAQQIKQSPPAFGAAGQEAAELVAPADTTILASYTFDDGMGSCDPQGWASADVHGGEDDYFHVADGGELNGGNNGTLLPLRGNQSLWCGSTSGCYACPPGYGNGWSQCFESVSFARGGNVTVKYMIRWDSEPGADVTRLQYVNATGDWTTLAQYSGTGVSSETFVIAAGLLPPGEVRLRFTFDSDPTTSNEDGGWCGDGACTIDSLSVADANGTVDFQDFELEPAGAKATNDGDWFATRKTFGDFAGLEQFPFVEDLCLNKECVWMFYSGSPDVAGACNPANPGQAVVPYGPNADGLYMNNEVRSPAIAWTGTGDMTMLNFCVYANLPIDNLVFYKWRLRWSGDGICWSGWCDENLVYAGDSKEWVERNFDVSDCIDPSAQFIQVALGAIDLCPAYCGSVGSGSCHTHAPMFDDVKVLRIEPVTGPRWAVEQKHLFQDNFPADGTAVGTVRIDRAEDTDPGPGISPGNTCIVTCTAPAGLENDLNVSGTINRPAVYLHARHVAGMTGQMMEDPGGDYPYTGSLLRWARYVMKPTGNPDEFEVNLNDGVFRPGDVIWYYFSACDANGKWTYWSEFTGTSETLAPILNNLMEMTCLPGPGAQAGGDVLYVNDGAAASDVYMAAFTALGIADKVDRFDVRDPGGVHGNGLGSRVTNPPSQLTPFYNVIMWNTGSHEAGTVGDGTGSPDQSDDWAVLLWFIDTHPNGGGVYLAGDNLACEWTSLAGAAATFRTTFMNHTVLDCCFRDLAASLNPIVSGLMPGTVFQEVGVPIDFLLRDGCRCCFDVLQPSAASQIEMVYDGNAAWGAVLSQETTNAIGQQARTLLSGFCAHKLKYDEPSELADLHTFVNKLLTYLGTTLSLPPVGIDDTPMVRANDLKQNYPNPFNPTTQIRYSLSDRVRVTLRVYDVDGKLVRTLVDGTQSPRVSEYQVAWDGRSDRGEAVASGVYFYRLVAGSYVATRKMVLLK